MKKKKNIENETENVQENSNANNKRNRLLIALGVVVIFDKL